MSEEQINAFWDKKSQDPLSHNRLFGIYVYLEMLEQFSKKCSKFGMGKFTSSGCTVGECKLWASLHAVAMLEENLFDGYDGVQAFYGRMKSEKATVSILSGEKTGGVLAQYFVRA